MAEDLRPYAGKLVRVIEADRTVTGVLDYLVDKHGQPAAGTAIVRDAAVRCGDVVVVAQHAERIEVLDAKEEPLRERAETAEALAADYARIVSRLQDAADRARTLAGEHAECDDPCWEHMPAIVAALDASLPPEEETDD